MERMRVNYKERQRLVAADLQSEQEYLSGLDQRHNLYQHAPGIVRGLNVRIGNGPRVIVEPGFAIDSFGREVVLNHQEFVEIDGQYQCLDVWLLYCRQPHRLRQTGRYSCSPDAFQRWNETPRILAVATGPEAPIEPPLDGAVFLGRIVCNNTKEIEYTALRGGEVADPGGRAEMQVGARTEWDPQGFVVNVADPTGKLTPRIAIDRRGNNVLSCTLELLQYRANGVVHLFNDLLWVLIKARDLGPAGENISVSVTERLQDNTRIGTITFERPTIANIPSYTESVEIPAAPEKRAENVKEFNQKSRLVVVEVLEGRPLKKKPVSIMATRDDRLPTLSLGGGRLMLKNWPEHQENPVHSLRGCDESVTGSNLGEGKKPNGLSFLPVQTPPTGPPTPKIYSAIGEEDDLGKVQLRIDLGEKKDGDESVRFSVGQTSGVDEWPDTWLTLEAPCGMTMIGELVVTGSIEQSLIQPDPDDPDFRKHLVKAWLEGLQSVVAASTIINITFEGLADLLETKKPWSYTVRLSNSEPSPATADIVLETLTSTGEPDFPTILKAGFEVPGSNNKTILVEHAAGQISVGKLAVEVAATGKIGTAPWQKSFVKNDIDVVETPKTDLTNLPDEVPPSSAWTHSFTVRNEDAKRGLQITEVLYKEFDNLPTSLLPAPIDLPPLQSVMAFDIPHPNGITTDMPVSVSVKYLWVDGPQDEITDNRTVEVANHIGVTFEFAETPFSIVAATDWNYSLALENVGSTTFSLIRLEQRLLGPNGQISNSQPIAIPTDFDVPPDVVLSLEDLEGIHASVANSPVRIEILAEYDRNGRTWQRLSTSDEITVRPAGQPIV